jgi:hypothetical protein
MLYHERITPSQLRLGCKFYVAFYVRDKVEIDIYNIRMLHFGGRDLSPINLPRIVEEEYSHFDSVMHTTFVHTSKFLIMTKSEVCSVRQIAAAICQKLN